MDASHESMGSMEDTAEKAVITNHQTEHHQNTSDVADTSEVPIFGVEDVSDSRDNKFPFLQIKPAETCDQTAYITSNGSSFGQRQQQSSDNCVLLSFADKPRPPTAVSVNFKTQIIFNFAQQILSHDTLARGPPAFFS